MYEEIVVIVESTAVELSGKETALSDAEQSNIWTKI